MIEIIKSNYFTSWLENVSRLARLALVELGNLGDHSSVGDGIYELRLFFGSGYRIYYIQQGSQLIILLYAGDKSSQAKDIKFAKQIALEWR